MIKKIFYIFIGAIIMVSGIAYAQSLPISKPAQGGTGTGQIPTVNQVPLGTAGGIYTPTNTTSLPGVQPTVTLTTTGSSGAATFTGNVLNIPQYTSTGGTFPFTSLPGYNATSTPLGLIGGFFSTASSTINAQLQVTGQATSSIQNFNTVEDASTYPGANMGAKINAAYAACPSTGCRITVPAGTFLFNTPIVFGTNGKAPDLYCPVGGGFYNNSGTVLQYTGTTGTSTSINTNNYVSGGGPEIDNCSFVGPVGTAQPGAISTSTDGIYLGGSAGAFGAHLDNVHISGFGTGLDVGSNVSFLNVTHSVINKNAVQISFPNVSGANGENNRITDSVLADGNNNLFGNSISNYCINIQLSGNVQTVFIGDSFDDCQIYINQSGGTANVTEVTNSHFENPNLSQTSYDYVSMLSNQPADTYISTGNTYMNDFTSGLSTEFILNGGHVASQGDNVEINNNVNVAMSNFITDQDTTDTVSWSGLTQGFANTSAPGAIKNVYGTTPYSTEGYGAGSSPAFYTLSPSGAVGFGTSSPTYGLDIQSPSSSQALRISQVSTAQFAGSGFNLIGPTSLGNEGGTYIAQENSNSGATKGDFTINQLDDTGGFVKTIIKANYDTSTLSLEANTGVASTSPWKELSVGTGNTGTFALSTSTSGCAQFSSFGELYSTGTACGSGGGSGTVNTGLQGQNAYYAANGTTVSATSTIFIAQNGEVGISTTTPFYALEVAGTAGNGGGQNLEVINTSGGGAGGGGGVVAHTSTVPVAPGDRLGYFLGGYSTGNNTNANAAGLVNYADQAWTVGSAQGAYATIETTGDNSTTRTERLRVAANGTIDIATTTGYAALTVASTTPMIDFNDTNAPANSQNWNVGNYDGKFIIGTSTDATPLSATSSALTIQSGGTFFAFGTTTQDTTDTVASVLGVADFQQSTSTFFSTGGINITKGCYAINGTCLSTSGGSGLSSYDAWTHPAAGISATTSQLTISGGALLIGSSTEIGNATTTGSLSAGSLYLKSLAASAGTFVAIDPNGLMIATTTPSGGSASLTGSTGQLPYFSGTNTAVGTSSLFLATNKHFGVSTTTPFGILSIDPTGYPVSVPSFVVGTSTTSTGTRNDSTALEIKGTRAYFGISDADAPTSGTSGFKGAQYSFVQDAQHNPGLDYMDILGVWSNNGSNTYTNDFSVSNDGTVGFNGGVSQGTFQLTGTPGGPSPSGKPSITANNGGTMLDFEGYQASNTGPTGGGPTGIILGGYDPGQGPVGSGSHGWPLDIGTSTQGFTASTTVAIEASTTQKFDIETFSATGAPLDFFGSTGLNGFGTTSPFATLSVVGVIPLAVSTSTGTSGMPNLEVDKNGFIVLSGPKPILSSCGTSSFDATTKSNDGAGEIDLAGTALTSCTMTFANAKVTPPVCTVSDNTTSSVADISSISTTQVGFALSVGVTSANLWYTCEGTQ